MIRVTVELISARTGQTSVLASATITNDGTGTRDRGNYDAAIGRKGGGIARNARIENFPRLSKNVWWLLARALNAAGYR